MAVLDIVFLCIIVIAAIRGAVRGFITELLTGAAITLAIAAGVIFCGPLGQIIAVGLKLTVFPEVIAFLFLFISVYLLVKLLERFLGETVENIQLEGLDRVLGFIIGIAEGILLCLLFIFICRVQPFMNPAPLFASSFLVKLVLPFMPAVPAVYLIK